MSSLEAIYKTCSSLLTLTNFSYTYMYLPDETKAGYQSENQAVIHYFLWCLFSEIFEVGAFHDTEEPVTNNV